MTEPSAEETLAKITALLDERVQPQEDEHLSVYERVFDVIVGFESWADLAIKRLHEIHRLTGEECDFCSKYLDQT